jgi:hypothetical protein
MKQLLRDIRLSLQFKLRMRFGKKNGGYEMGFGEKVG